MFTSLSNASKNTMKTSFRSASICDSLYRHIPTLSNTYDGDYSNNSQCILASNYTAWKVSKYRVFSGPYFPVFGLNTEIGSVNFPIQSQYKKIRTRKNPYLDMQCTFAERSIIDTWQSPKNVSPEKFCSSNWPEFIRLNLFIYSILILDTLNIIEHIW